MNFDPDREPTEPRHAASVLLLRARPDGEAEVFLLRRHRHSKFMASAFVFPGGAVDPGEDALKAAARELFEEAGVLLVHDEVEAETLAAWRRRVLDGEPFEAVLEAGGVRLDLDLLSPYAHWITPSAEARRFSAVFFVALLPAGQTPSFDDRETVDERWATPAEAYADADALALPPPQLHSVLDLREVARSGPEAVLAHARERARDLKPILPRYVGDEGAPGGFALLFPWDPDYGSRGTGASHPWPPGHPHGRGPSRVVRDASGWRLLEPPC